MKRPFSEQLSEFWGIPEQLWDLHSRPTCENQILRAILGATSGIAWKRKSQPKFSEIFFQNWGGPRAPDLNSRISGTGQGKPAANRGSTLRWTLSQPYEIDSSSLLAFICFSKGKGIAPKQPFRCTKDHGFWGSILVTSGRNHLSGPAATVILSRHTL